MRYVIIGAGAIGGGIGGLLADAGVPVVLVARGAHLAAMREHGLTIRSPERAFTVRPDAAGGPDDVRLGVDDVLVLSTKTHQAAAALAAWADAPVHATDGTIVGTAGERLPLITALNGVASEEIALRWFARVIGCCVWMPAVHLEPGEVIVRSHPVSGIMHLGRVPVPLADDADRDLLARIAADWARGGIQVPSPPDVMAWKRRKLIGNLGNAFQALLGDASSADDLLAAARAEAHDLFARAGLPLNTDEEEAGLRSTFVTAPVPGEPEQMGGSTWQSFARGTGQSEVDYLNGEIVALAHRLGRTAPVNAAVCQVARTAAAQGRRPGETTLAELRAAVREG